MLDDPMVWAGIWLVVALAFAASEIAVAGTFFLAPFAAGATVAAVASFFQAPLLVSWAFFLVVSFVAFLALRPLARRMDDQIPATRGVGANRLVGQQGTVTVAIASDGDAVGTVKLGGEEWPAICRDASLPVGAQVTVDKISGTRVLVRPVDQAEQHLLDQ